MKGKLTVLLIVAFVDMLGLIIVYPLLPVIYETAHQNGIRPERPMAVATIASQQAITASPVAAATAAMIGLFAEKGITEWGLPQILMVCVPSTLIGVIAAAVVSMFIGKDLKDDPEYQARLKAGQIPAPKSPAERPNTTRSMSELEPSRLAPWTETQAASPTANRPGTTLSGLPSFSVTASPWKLVGMPPIL